MRIKVKFKTNNSTLPINNQHIINGYIHKVLGQNNVYHDVTSIYNISNIRGGKYDKNTNRLIFNKEAYFLVSSLNSDFINTFMGKLFSNIFITDGFEFNGVDIISEQMYSGYNHFSFLSPVIIKKNNKMHSIKDNDFHLVFEEYLKKVANKHFGQNVDLSVEISLKNSKTKLVNIKGINNLCSHFNFTINCNKKVAELFYYTGIGLSRGSGFGTIVPSSKLMEYL